MMIFFLHFGIVVLAVFFPDTAWAQVDVLSEIIDNTVGDTPLMTDGPSIPTIVCANGFGSGACSIAQTLVYGIRQIRLLAGALAFAILVVAGFRLVISQSEEAIATARRSVIGAATGLFLIFIVEPILDGFYGGFSSAPATRLDSFSSAQDGVIILSRELLGIVSWLETLVAIVAVGLIVAQAVSVLGSFGSEDRIKKLYHALFATVFGILLIIFDRTIVEVFGLSPNATAMPTMPTTYPIFVEVFGLIRFVLLFVAIVVIGVLVYAGFLLMLHMGNEEMVSSGKKVLTNAAIGLVLLAVSFVIVSTVILGL